MTDDWAALAMYQQWLVWAGLGRVDSGFALVIGFAGRADGLRVHVIIGVTVAVAAAVRHWLERPPTQAIV